MTTAYKIFSGIKKGKSRMMRAQKLNIKMSQRGIEKSVFHCVRGSGDGGGIGHL